MSEVMQVVRVENHAPLPATREDRRWWTKSGSDLATAVTGMWTQLHSRAAPRLERWRQWWELYGDDPMARDSGDAGKRLTSSNGCHSTVQTCLAHIAKARPRPLFQTTKGDNALQKKAEKLTTYVEGVFKQIGIHEIGKDAFRDGAVMGTGLAHVWPDVAGKCIRAEYLTANEVEVPPHQGRNPRSMFRRHLMERDEACARWPDFAEAIAERPAPQGADDWDDRIEVIEAWHLPTREPTWVKDGEPVAERGNGAKPQTDGRHVFVCGTEVLHDEPWTWGYFPIVPLYWETPTPSRGWWGLGLVELVAGKQQEIDDLDKDISVAHRLGGRPMFLVEDGSQVDEDQISNEIMAVLRYKGVPPSVIQTPTLNPAIYQERQQKFREMFEESGVSHSNATGQKPAGVEAAVAIREVNDLSGTRFVIKGQTNDAWYMTIARMVCDFSRWLYSEHKVDLATKGAAGKFIEDIKWSTVDMDDDQFWMDLFPASLLPTTPMGRLQTVTEMIEKGMLSPLEGRHLLDVPDIGGARGMTLEDEAWEYAVEVVGDILEGKRPDIDPRSELDILMNRLLANYVKAIRPGSLVKPAIREVLREYMDTVMRWLDMKKAGATPDEMMAGEMPPPPAPPGPEMPPGGPMDPGPMPPDMGMPPGGAPPIPPELAAAAGMGAPPPVA